MVEVNCIGGDSYIGVERCLDMADANDLIIIPDLIDRKFKFSREVSERLSQTSISSPQLVFVNNAYKAIDKRTTIYKQLAELNQKLVNKYYVSDNKNIHVCGEAFAFVDLLSELIDRGILTNSSKGHWQEALNFSPRANYKEKAQEADKKFSIAKLTSWAEENVSQVKTVEQLANSAPCTRRTFDRIFRKEMGCSAKNWLSTIKIKKAKLLLKKQVMSIEEVAEQCGFDSSATFRNQFIQLEDVSPSEYKKRYFNI